MQTNGRPAKEERCRKRQSVSVQGELFALASVNSLEQLRHYIWTCEVACRTNTDTLCGTLCMFTRLHQVFSLKRKSTDCSGCKRLLKLQAAFPFDKAGGTPTRFARSLLASLVSSFCGKVRDKSGAEDERSEKRVAK